MQTLGGTAAPQSDNDSITSLEYHKPNNSTIGMLYYNYCVIFILTNYML